MNTKQWVLLVAIFGLLAGCSQGSVPVEPTTTPIPNETLDPSPAPIRSGVTILADGVVQAIQPVLPLAFETGGKLLSVHVQAGDQLQAGDLIATLDDTALREAVAHAALQVDQAENNLAQAQQVLTALEVDLPLRQAEAQQALAFAQENLRTAETQLNSLGAPATEAAITTAQSAVTFTDKALKRAEKSYQPYRNKPDGNLNKAYFGAAWAEAQQNYDTALRRLNSLTGSPSDLTQSQREAELAVAQAQIAQAQANLDKLLGGHLDEIAQLNVDQAEISMAQSELSLAQAEADLEKSELIAPWTGTVLSITASPGALVGSGSPIVSLLDTTQLEFNTFNLSERDLTQIYPGQRAIVTLKTYPNEPISATVARIGWQAGAPVGDAATFPIMLVLSETDLEIRPGMTGRVEIHSEE
jgi:multidrug resistance efflux pump